MEMQNLPRPAIWLRSLLIASLGRQLGEVWAPIRSDIGRLQLMPQDSGFEKREFSHNGIKYLLFRQDVSLLSPEGVTFGIFACPVEPFAKPVHSRVMRPGEDERTLWEEMEQMARRDSLGRRGSR